MEKDTSIDAYFEVLSRQKEQLKQAKLCRGQKPTSSMVRSRQQLEQEFMALSYQTMMQQMSLNDTCMMLTAFIGEAYPPSLKALSELTPIAIRDLRLETQHRGRVLLARTFCQPTKMTSITNAIEDNDGDVSRVTIYNLPVNADPQKVLPQGAFIAVKEPYFKVTADGAVIVRVDHAADLFILPPGDERIPTKLRSKARALASKPSATQLKLLGNDAFKRSDWLSALEHYTSALALDDVGQDLRCTLLRNRAGTLLRLSRYEMALEDSLASIIPGAAGGLDGQASELNLKALYRAGEAAYELREFARAKDHYEQALALYPAHKETLAAVRRTQKRLEEEDEGKFDFAAMSRSATKNHRILDHASFTKNTTVQPAGEKLGRGLFAAKDLEFGDAILVEKAFCIEFKDDNARKSWVLLNPNSNRAKSGTHALCLWSLIEKMTFNPRQAARYLDLHDGGGFGGAKEPPRLDGRVVLDTFQVQSIAEFNGFACAEVKSSPAKGPSKDSETDHSGSMGIWLRASYANHSCLPNASRSFIGDMMVVRANRRIKAGEQIVMPYTSPLDSYADRQKSLKDGYGFRCECSLCEADSKVSAKVARLRKRLVSEAEAIIDANPMALKPASCDVVAIQAMVQKLKKLNDQIRRTYHESLYVGVPRVACESVGTWLCQATVAVAGTLDAGLFLELLRDLGYKCTMDGDKVDLDASGGLLTHSVLCVVMYAADSGAALGRMHVATVLEQFARTAFTIQYGSDEAFDSFFGRLRGN